MSDDAAIGRRRKPRHNRSHVSQAENVEPAPLLATKLYRPRPRADLVARPRLRARLEAGLQGRLTLIAAPAGFGKTTLLAEWLSQVAATDRQVAWLSLDGGDSDPGQFLRYLIAALQMIDSSVGVKVLSLLRSARLPALDTVLPWLANDLAVLPEGSLLVLDDYHAVDALAVHQGLTFLVDHLPPQLHLVLASRADPPLPLARWRARGALTELRAQDLRFTTEEAQTFFEDVMDVPLSAADVAAVEARTEGWVAGLQLAALSLQDRPAEQRAALIDGFTGSHRFIVDYLVDDVLAGQPEHLQRFLLHTAILERLSGPLCDAVLGVESRPGSADDRGAYSQLVLEELERSNLFIVALDEQRRWYRYHHLFAQVLQERLARDASGGARGAAVALLHRRASHWFAAHGLAAEAIQHALAAEDWDHAAQLIEAHGPRLVVGGSVHTVLRWLAALPDAQFPARPDLYAVHGLALFFVNQLEAAELRLQAGESQLPAAPLDARSRATLGYITVIRASIARFRGDLLRCVSLARQALELIPESNAMLRASPSVDVASDYVITGDVGPANERRLLAAVAAVAASGDLQTHVTSLVLLAGLRRRQGRLRDAVATYRAAAEVAAGPDGQRAIINSAAHHFRLGDVLREWNQLDAAADLLRQGRELVLGTLVTQADILTFGYISIARLQQAQGDGAGARATLAELHALVQQRNFVSHLLTRAAAARAHLALLQDDLAGAVDWADTSGLAPDDDPTYVRELEYLVLARVRIAQGRGDAASPTLPDALRLLDRLLEAAQTGARTDSVIEILLLRALALDAQGQAVPARAALEQALSRAAPEGYVRLFVDEGAPLAALLAAVVNAAGWGQGQRAPVQDVRAYAEQLVAVLHTEGVALSGGAARAPQARTTPSGEVLTEREREVLQLLAAGRSNAAIADTLVVAVGTVKRHVNSIMGKLQVQSRLEAVARARELDLV